MRSEDVVFMLYTLIHISGVKGENKTMLGERKIKKLGYKEISNMCTIFPKAGWLVCTHVKCIPHSGIMPAGFRKFTKSCDACRKLICCAESLKNRKDPNCWKRKISER